MPDETRSEAERLVEEALEAGILRQNGSHFYAAREEGEDEHVGQGHEAALSWLKEEGHVEEAPEQESSAGEEKPEPEPGEEDASAEEDALAEEEGGEDVPPEGIYRHEGDEMVTFEREGRADGMLFPGGIYQNLPLENDDIQRLIGEGVLVDIS